LENQWRSRGGKRGQMGLHAIPGAGLGAHQHTFCSHLNTRFKQKFRPIFLEINSKKAHFLAKSCKNRLSVGNSALEPPFAFGA